MTFLNLTLKSYASQKRKSDKINSSARMKFFKLIINKTLVAFITVFDFDPIQGGVRYAV